MPVTPARFLDTRSGVGAAVIPTTAGASVDLKVAGTRGVPAQASAARPQPDRHRRQRHGDDVRAYPRGAARVPTVSNVNLVRGDTRANLAIVRVGTDGRVRVRNSSALAWSPTSRATWSGSPAPCRRRPVRSCGPAVVVPAAAQPWLPSRTSCRMSASTASNALRAATRTGSQTGAKGGA